MKEIELICIDDGSTDSSLAILHDYQKRDERICIADLENHGAGAARNFGMRCASGEYLCFMDSDDWYPERDILQILYENAVMHNVTICGGSFCICRPGESEVTEFTGNDRGYRFERDGLLFYQSYQYDYGFQRFIYDRMFLKMNQIEFPEYLCFEDPPFFVQSMIKARKFYALSKITYAYRAGYKKREWTEQSLSDCLRGMTDNLRYSEKYKLAGLYQLTSNRWKDEVECVAEMLGPKASDMFDQLLKDIQLKTRPRPLEESKDWNIWHRQEGMHAPAPRRSIADHACRTIKVSVVIPIYNVEAYLAECLDTLLDQTLREIEIICVNDGSTDFSRAIIEEFMSADQRIILIDRTHEGQSSARNAGMKKAGGRYICFVDSDDYLEQNALKELYEEAESGSLDLLCFRTVVFAETENAARFKDDFLYFSMNNSYKGIMKGEELYGQMIKNGDFKFSACIILLRKKFLDSTGIKFYEGIIYEDNLFSVQCFLQAGRAEHLNRSYYHRRVREGSIMNSPVSGKNVYSCLVIILEWVKLINTWPVSEKIVHSLISFMRKNERNMLEMYDHLSEADVIPYLKDDREKRAWFDVLVNEPSRIIRNWYGEIDGPEQNESGHSLCGTMYYKAEGSDRYSGCCLSAVNRTELPYINMDFEFENPVKGIRLLRFDPGETGGFVLERMMASVSCTDGSVLHIPIQKLLHNGFRAGISIVYTGSDPQVLWKVNPAKAIRKVHMAGCISTEIPKEVSGTSGHRLSRRVYNMLCRIKNA